MEKPNAAAAPKTSSSDDTTSSLYLKANDDHHHDRLLSDVTEAIGNTPLVNLSRLAQHYGVDADGGRILAKLEYLQPGFSKKDRIAKQIIQEAMESGELQPHQTVVELTSGNTGTGLAIVCCIYGFPFCAVMSKGNSMERARMMRALGAEVVLVDQAPTSSSTPGQVSGDDLALVEEKTKEIVLQRNAFRADQIRRHGNATAHYHGTGPEIWHASGGSVTAFCDFVGTGGSFAGCAAYFKQQQQQAMIQCYIVEPAGAAVLAGQDVTRPNHRIQGGGYVMRDLEQLQNSTNNNNNNEYSNNDDDDDDNNYINDAHNNVVDTSGLIDGFLQVTDEQAIQMARDLARYEGIFGGFSAGANVAAAVQLLQTPKHKGGTIAVLICDSGLKYLSTDLWEEQQESQLAAR